MNTDENGTWKINETYSGTRVACGQACVGPGIASGYYSKEAARQIDQRSGK